MRKAIAMIELIFAIVIIGITLLSAPLLIDRSAQSNYVALKQESIAAAATQISMIMTANWDRNNAGTAEGSPVLQTGGTSICNTLHPVGVSSTSGRYCTGTGSGIFINASAIGADTNETGFYDDVDDYHLKSYTVSVYNSETYEAYEGDYINRDITISSRVNYGSDAIAYSKTMQVNNPFTTIVTANSTNIKLINVRLESSNPADENELSDVNITLSAFVCNIGAPRPDIINNRPNL
ncbi:MAG: type II secretion system protein [Campylobacterales bacterium]|nr:type II secretion system protein [Campylobacterales bacterium]